jgi:CRP-like cAMP-binding protein
MAVYEDLRDTIAGLALFADLSMPQLEQVAHRFEEARFSEGERILRQGISGSGFYVILDGSAAIRVDGVKRASLRAGDYFGEISCLLGETPVADIVAEQPLRCLVLPSAQLEGFLTANPKVMFRLLQAETRRLRNTTKWLS